MNKEEYYKERFAYEAWEDQREEAIERFASINNLEDKFLELFPEEERPLDDDFSDWLDNHAEEYYNFIVEGFDKFVNAGGFESD